MRPGRAPRTMAALPNLAIGVLHLTGCDDFAAGLREHGRDAARPWPPSAAHDRCGNGRAAGAVGSPQKAAAGTRRSSPCALPAAASFERGSMMLS